MKTLRLVQAVGSSLQTRGLGPTVSRIATLARERFWARSTAPTSEFDLATGMNTEAIEPLWKLSIDSPNAVHGVRYQPANPDWVRADLNLLRIEHQQFDFIDMGAGKGRVLAIAREYPFRRVIGVEFSRELCEIAQANLSRPPSTPYRCEDAVCVHGDAADYEFAERNTVLFLYNPFGEAVMTKVLANLERTFSDSAIQLRIIYLNAKLAPLLDKVHFLHRQDSPGIGVIYTNQPPPSSGKRDRQ